MAFLFGVPFPFSNEEVEETKQAFDSLRDSWVERARNEQPVNEIESSIIEKADRGKELTQEERKLFHEWADSVDKFQEKIRDYMKECFDGIQEKHNLSDKHLEELEKRCGFVRSPKAGLIP